jgi:DNA-3-methyladenine glycosylase II
MAATSSRSANRSPADRTISVVPRGPFSLAASIRFLEGFAPADYGRHAPGAPLRLAFPLVPGTATVAVAVRQEPDGTVTAEVNGDADLDTVRGQVARILSLDVDGSGFPQVVHGDPVAGSLADRYPGLRPVCFYSPYEAAVWAVISHRIRITQAARIKARIAERYGEQVAVADATVSAFPAPEVLAKQDEIPGLSQLKTERLNAIAEAARSGDLDAGRLRAMPTEEALAALQRLPGIGPFSAELILVRGAGHPDVFPGQERRLHAAMTEAYGLDDPGPAQLAEIAARWTPYRSWVALLFRVYREEVTGEVTSGRSLPRHASARDPAVISTDGDDTALS